ncbi:ubiquitin carboxyl-terminal hydrolase MINDY-1-like, partial [Brachypodium distachyon]|uniref:ubiquitin carboxyl-terminal hydrolase MINDY-1-like n=1 Tax=Brachypodium distachyon TaxID=15368 RepID=UPI00053006FA
MAEYKIVNIKSDGKTKKIVCDHPDGTFPLVAVINYLSLHRNLCIENNWEQLIYEKDLLETIQNLLDSVDGWSPEDNTSWNQESTVLPMLATQIDLDPYLNSIDGFGTTAAVLEIIKVLDIPLFHGCLMDPKKASALHGCAYSSILELCTIEPLPGAKATDLEQWLLIREFVEMTDKQLNSYGISCIRDHMILNNQKFAVLYRNGEFKLLGLHHGIIHILQTEAGDFENVEFDRLCVWKTLFDEDGIAVTGNLRAVDDENTKD